jgi:hypothetical protein
VDGRPISGINTSSHFYVGNQDWSALAGDIIGASSTLVYDAGDPQDGDPAGMPGGMIITGKTYFSLKCRISIDPKATYSVSVRARKLVDTVWEPDGPGGNTDLFYVGALSLDENFEYMQTDNASSYQYGVAKAEELKVADGVQTYTGLFSGYNLASEGDHNKFDPEAKSFDLRFITQYYTDATGFISEGKTLIESVEIRRVVKDGIIGVGNVGIDGNVGIGTDSPAANLHIRAADGTCNCPKSGFTGR